MCNVVSKAFAAHWFQAIDRNVETGRATAREFLAQLFRAENQPIQELAATPILLSLTCGVFQRTGKFSSKRSKLYEEGLELLLEQWDKSRTVERDEVYKGVEMMSVELTDHIAFIIDVLKKNRVELGI